MKSRTIGIFSISISSITEMTALDYDNIAVLTLILNFIHISKAFLNICNKEAEPL